MFILCTRYRYITRFESTSSKSECYLLSSSSCCVHFCVRCSTALSLPRTYLLLRIYRCITAVTTCARSVFFWYFFLEQKETRHRYGGTKRGAQKKSTIQPRHSHAAGALGERMAMTLVRKSNWTNCCRQSARMLLVVGT